MTHKNISHVLAIPIGIHRDNSPRYIYECRECGTEISETGKCFEYSEPCYYCSESCPFCGRGFCDQSC